MIRLTQNRWFRRVALGTVAAIGLGSAMLPSTPAKAGVVIGFGAPGYVAPYAYGPYAYGPYASGYDYPYYGYPTGGVYFGFGGGHYHHHWR
ncbi:MAG TPA: hypothetical protein VHW66_05090 [Stellaceae bacterium]|jgi:hypothetical protein|nr:hypothetical protein [Stellaceae bacterium]